MIKRAREHLLPVEAGQNQGRLDTFEESGPQGSVGGIPPSGVRLNLAAIAAGIISALVMVLNLDTHGLTGDEGFTAQMVKLPWSTMLSDLQSIDYNMSLHYIALKGWTEVFGTSEVALRIPSVIFALGSLALLYRLVKHLFGLRVAVLATVLLALNPFFIEVGLTARTYAMLMFWSVAATFALVRALEDQSRNRWLWYGFAAAVGLHLHLFSALVIAAHGLFALIDQRRVIRHNLEAVGVIVVLGIVPTAIFLAPSNTLSWIGPFSPSRAAGVGLAVAGGGILGGAIIALALAGLFSPRAGRMKWLPAIWLVIPVTICLALVPFQSLFIDIYFAVVAAPLAVAAALGLRWLLKHRDAWVVPAGVAVAGVGLGLTLATSEISAHQGWREIPELVAGKVREGDVVAFPNAYYRIVAEYYAAEPLAGPFPPGDPTLPTAVWGSLRPYQLDMLKRTGLQTPHEIFEAQTVGHERVWLVGHGDAINRTVGEHLVESHGYRVEETVAIGRTEANLYVSG